MKCRDCGKEGFANVGEVARHKKTECPAKDATTNDPEEDKGAPQNPFISIGKPPKEIPVIPWERCDPTLRVLSRGTPMPLVVLGVITSDGVEVMEVHPMRRGR